MTHVEILKLKNDGTQEILVTCRLVGEQVVCEGDEIFVRNLEREGIFDYSSPEYPRPTLFFKDGRKFLEQLQNHFRSGYLIATEVKE